MSTNKGDKGMSKVITEKEIQGWIQDRKVIIDGDTNCAEGIKYDFRLGKKFLKAYFGRVMDFETDLKSADDIRKAVVEPGEVVFVLSEERLMLPSNIYAQLSPKRSLSQDGIELMGGLTIDPNYEGYLVFGLRNVAGTPYALEPGTKIVGANFFELAEDEKINDQKKPVSIVDFPEKLLTLIGKYKPVNPQNLERELVELQRAFRDSQGKLGAEVRELNDKVDEISREFLKESTKRDQESKSLNDRFSLVESQLKEIGNKTIAHDVKMDALKEEIKDIRGNISIIKNDTDEIKTSIVKTRAEAGIKAKVVTAVITFFITVLAGIIVAYFQGWIS